MAIGTRLMLTSLILGRIATAQPVVVGEPAPKLTLGQAVQGRVDEGLPRQATVLEFWATWCPPCREAIPHLNQLADQFKDRPIQFISISDESKDTVTAFLKTHPMRGIIALDPGGRTYQLYAAGLPTTVLIAGSGRIAAVANDPKVITPALLEDLLSERPVGLPALPAPGAGTLIAFGKQINDRAALVRIVITPVWQESGWIDAEDLFESDGASLSKLLEFAYDTSSTRIIVPEQLKQRIFAVQAWVPPRHANLLRPFMQNALAAAAGFQTRRERRSVEVLVVNGLPGMLHEPHPKNPVSRAAPGHITGDGTALDILRQQIETVTGKPVALDHPGITNVQYDLHWDVTKPGSFEAALRDQLGLELKPEQREIEFLVVEELEKNKP
jgi:uncharacterized protein (TIGR03435 family)